MRAHKITDTMNIVPFAFQSNRVRMALIDDAPWFHAADVCAALDIANASQAVAQLAPKHKAMHCIGLPGSAPTFISEAGLYKIIMRSNKPEAEGFQDWITEEVLPSIRATGSYGVAAPHRAALDTLRRIHEAADREIERKTQHCFYRPGNAREQEQIASVLAEVAGRTGLDASAVELARCTTVQQVMAERYGDTYAATCIAREKARIEAEVARRVAANRRPTKRRR
jgi:prophage antirepressor-like protein